MHKCGALLGAAKKFLSVQIIDRLQSVVDFAKAETVAQGAPGGGV
ncbi:MAG: hypothetical protein BJ554DRAFT_4998 [Olpidium bornovanus]|uniref:Uncharacterized protein n=1 Tax=Olpidium bornovanus TaxID=278681 RepID=A0A8H7ZM67_9FUNG|nr:MAG: hypothetical protein BJ554DRAFT_4998 [Olpidium bornovanus]